MGWKATIRAMEAAQRRQQREALRRQHESEQQAKELEKLSVTERAKVEVQTYENHLADLISIHKEQGEAIDWKELVASLPPPPPEKKSFNELRIRQQIMVLQPEQRHEAEAQVEKAQMLDEQTFRDEVKTYWEQKADWERLKNLSRRVLAGEHKAYTEAILEFNPFAETSQLGSSINFMP